jgi:hypothetical protein
MKIFLKIIGIAIIALIIILITGFFWVTNGKLTNAKRNILKFFPYPIALVNNMPVFANTYLKRLDLAEKNSPQTGKLPAQVFSQIINEERIKQIAGKYNVTAGKNDVNEEFEFYKNTYEKAYNKPFTDELLKYSLSSEEFKSSVLFPQVLKNKLKIWYNKQKNLNPDAYSKIEYLSRQIEQEKDFGQLAQNYSEDAAAKQVKGDTGFLEQKDLLPEIRLDIKDLKKGDIKIISTRFGINFIKIEETANSPQEGSQKIRLRQIFIKTSGFEQWLILETKKIQVKQILKFN